MSTPNKYNKLIVILGPTASGKSELALKLAKKFNGEIVNADSRQIYKKMDIGTGKLDIGYWILDIKKSRKTISDIRYPISNNGRKQISDIIPIHLIDIINPDQEFSLAQYKKLAVKTIKEIQKRGKLPILVGGTGLYISAVVDNLEIPKAPPSVKIREVLEKKSGKYLFSQLKKVDPKSAEIIGPRNKRKLIRALEVYKITGKPFSDQQVKGEPLFNILQIGVKTDRKKLYKKIDRRVDKMIKDGLVEETKKLSKKYSSDLPAMSGIGYKEIGDYLKNKDTLENAAQKIKFRTHQYARRQMTWFKRDKRIKWVKSYGEARKLVFCFLKDH